jgi:hypothetical protein
MKTLLSASLLLLTCHGSALALGGHNRANSTMGLAEARKHTPLDKSAFNRFPLGYHRGSVEERREWVGKTFSATGLGAFDQAVNLATRPVEPKKWRQVTDENSVTVYLPDAARVKLTVKPDVVQGEYSMRMVDADADLVDRTTVTFKGGRFPRLTARAVDGDEDVLLDEYREIRLLPRLRLVRESHGYPDGIYHTGLWRLSFDKAATDRPTR